jgi:hypothetical protein
LPLSSAASVYAWRFTAKWFSVYEFACAVNAAQYFFFVPIVIVAIAIAAWPVAIRRESSSDEALTVDTSRAQKDGWIIATGNAITGNVAPGPA